MTVLRGRSTRMSILPARGGRSMGGAVIVKNGGAGLRVDLLDEGFPRSEGTDLRALRDVGRAGGLAEGHQFVHLSDDLDEVRVERRGLLERVGELRDVAEPVVRRGGREAPGQCGDERQVLRLERLGEAPELVLNRRDDLLRLRRRPRGAALGTVGDDLDDALDELRVELAPGAAAELR